MYVYILTFAHEDTYIYIHIYICIYIYYTCYMLYVRDMAVPEDGGGSTYFSFKEPGIRLPSWSEGLGCLLQQG